MCVQGIYWCTVYLAAASVFVPLEPASLFGVVCMPCECVME